VQVEKELQFLLNLHTGRSLTESTITDAAFNKIRPPDDEHSIARNM